MLQHLEYLLQHLFSSIGPAHLDFQPATMKTFLTLMILQLCETIPGKAFQSNLYLYSKTEQQIGTYKESHCSIPAIGVTKARTQDTGCFQLFEKENFEGAAYKVGFGENFDADTLELKEITVRSIRHLPEDCANVSDNNGKSEDCTIVSDNNAIFIGIGLFVLVILVPAVLYIRKWAVGRMQRDQDSMELEDL